jgi:hypothetical protein
MAKIIRTAKYVRGPLGVKWAFIVFNFLMLWWLFGYWSSVDPLLHSGSEAHRAGATIGATMGTAA